MDPRLLRLQERELRFLHELGGEFAQDFPKVAQRLRMRGIECDDPYVERLLEGFSFLTARIQLKLEAEFPRFTQHLLERVYPDYLAPTPSMLVARFEPDLSEGQLADGFVLPRGTSFRSALGRGVKTPCEYRTAHEVTLWPIELTEASYGGPTGELVPNSSALRSVRAVLRLRLRSTAGLDFNKLAIERLPIYLTGPTEITSKLHEQLLGHRVRAAVRDPASGNIRLLSAGALQPLGFGDDEALLPYGPRSFQGYRLLEEYFDFPQRFLFVEFGALETAVRSSTGSELDLLVYFDGVEDALRETVDASRFALFCSPAINLVEKRTDRVTLTPRAEEFRVVVDRTRPVDYEVHTVQSVMGFGAGNAREEFRPLYNVTDRNAGRGGRSFFTARRDPRLLGEHYRRLGRDSSYVGSEISLALVDADETPLRTDLRELEVRALCTNRDLPLYMSLGRGATDFSLQTGAPVDAIRCVAGPTAPRPSRAQGETTWQLISHLSLNYLSLVDSDEETGAAGLRDLLMLYADASNPAMVRQVDGVRSISSEPTTALLPSGDRTSLMRGVEITLRCDENAFEGTGVFLLGAVLAQFFARYVSINSFTQTLVETVNGAKVMEWPPNVGRRLIL